MTATASHASRLPAAIDRRPLAAATIAAVASLLTNAPGLGERSLSFDETWTAVLALRPLQDLLFSPIHDQNPPLYKVLMASWAWLFGISEPALRMPSLLATAATAAMLLAFARRVLGAETALFATLLFLASRPQAFYAGEARAYALASALCVGSFWAFARLLERPTAGRCLALGVINALGAYTHYTLAFAFVVQVAALAWLARERPRTAAMGVLAQIVALVLFAPEIRSLLASTPRAGNWWLAPPTGTDLRTVATALAGGAACLAVAAIPLLGTAWASLRGRHVGRDAEGRGAGAGAPWLAVCAAWAILPVLLAWVVSLRVPLFLVRYVLFASLGWFLLVAGTAARAPLPPAARLGLGIAMAVAAAAAGTTPGTFAADWRAAARLALDGRTPRSAVVVVPEHQCLPFAYYADRDAIADRRDVGERLRGERIACLRDVRDLSLPALDWPDRIAVIALDRSRADVAGLGARLERQGYVRGSTTAFPGGDVLVYESAERRGADAPANPAAQGPP